MQFGLFCPRYSIDSGVAVTVRKGDRVSLPNEGHSVTVRGVSHDDAEITIFYDRADGTRDEVTLTREDFEQLIPIMYTGLGNPRRALAALWGYWITGAIAGIRQAALATAPLRAYSHQDQAVYEVMLPQPTMRFILADEPGTGKTIMCGMYMVEMMRQQRLKRVLLVVPAHLLSKWERDLERFFGIQTERLTAEIGKSTAPLHPDRDFWLVSIDLLARNHQVARKAVYSPESAWDLVVFDEGHRLTPTAQSVYAVAEELANRSTHLLVLTATPHRGSEYLFRALVHLLDPDLYPWSESDAALLGPYAPRLKPARTHFLRRMKEQLRDYDNVTPLFTKRRAHNVSVALSATELQLYEDVLAYCDDYLDDVSGLARSIYGKRAASSFFALSETLRRRAERLQHGDVHSASRSLEQMTVDAFLIEDDEGQANFEYQANSVRSKNSDVELASNIEIRARIADLITGPATMSAKWHPANNLLLQHNIRPGSKEQLLIFTEYADTARWLERLFRKEGFAVRRYSGDVPREERERIQVDFQDRKFEVLISTDAGNEGIDLQSAHVLVNWDIPWSIVRLEQRAGRLHRIGQRSQVDIYNLISTSTREGRVQEVILGNIVAAADALDGKIFDFLGSVVEQLGIDYGRLNLQASAGGQALDQAIAEAKQRTVQEYSEAANAQRQIEGRLATPIDARAFQAHSLQDRLDAINPAVVAAFLRVVCAAYGWTLRRQLHEYVYQIDAGSNRRLPRALGGNQVALVAVSTEGILQARREGADLSDAILLGPAEPTYRLLVQDIGRDTADSLAMGATLHDPSAMTPYELFVFDAALVRKQTSHTSRTAHPLLIRWDRSGARVVAWQSVAHLEVVPISGESTSQFSVGPQSEADAIAKHEMGELAERERVALRSWAEGVSAQLRRLQDEVVEPYQELPFAERKARHDAVARAVSERQRLLMDAAEVVVQGPRLVGRVKVIAGNASPRELSQVDSEMQAMRLCKLLLEDEGFQVEDVHQSGCGYDLHATREYEQRCVEVKGLQTDIAPGIMLESSEWLMAQQYRDDYWVYVIVDCASEPRLFAAYRNPVAVFGDEKQLVQRFHVAASTLRRVLP
jgi:superfamily II DNA or RNA helicase